MEHLSQLFDPQGYYRPIKKSFSKFAPVFVSGAWGPHRTRFLIPSQMSESAHLYPTVRVYTLSYKYSPTLLKSKSLVHLCCCCCCCSAQYYFFFALLCFLALNFAFISNSHFSLAMDSCSKSLLDSVSPFNCLIFGNLFHFPLRFFSHSFFFFFPYLKWALIMLALFVEHRFG